MKAQHPAISALLDGSRVTEPPSGHSSSEYTTSPSLARALAIGALSRLDTDLTTVEIWDPASGSGFAGHMIVEALQSTGVQVRFRGQDISENAVAISRRRFNSFPNCEVEVANSIERDAFSDFKARVVIVDAPWGMEWSRSKSAVEARRGTGEYGFGIPRYSDSTWLFLSLAIEKLVPPEQGGGRVAALVSPSALSDPGSAAIRQSIVKAGLLESVSRLPEGLAPNTGIPLFLLTFTNCINEPQRGKVRIADLRTQFSTYRHERSMPLDAFKELEYGIRSGKPGPRNRVTDVRRLIRREGKLSRRFSQERGISWRVTTYNDTYIDENFLKDRYGANSGISIDGEVKQLYDFNPSPIFNHDARYIRSKIKEQGWPSTRLSAILEFEPRAVTDSEDEPQEGDIYIPTTKLGKVATSMSSTESSGRVISIRVDRDVIDPSFLSAWLNSEQGVASRRRAIDASSSGTYVVALRSDPASLMRWADELIVAMPDRNAQLALAFADQRLASFEADLSTRRASMWTLPDTAEEVVSSLSIAFDKSLSTWLDQLPFPVASALWTAEAARSPGEQQQAYLHAWEAMVAFHATVLLSACRSDPGNSAEVETDIRETLNTHKLGIERASFATWVIIIERTSKDLRRALESAAADEIARVRRAFADLDVTSIERLISKDVVAQFKEVNSKRNRWRGHGGHTLDSGKSAQVDALISDLRELRNYLGSSWSQLQLVRAGVARKVSDHLVQIAEVAVGTRSPFKTKEFSVGEMMNFGELYLLRDGAQSPLKLAQFVQLRSAPSNALYTSYFYNRTEGNSVHLVSYQYGPDGEAIDDVGNFSNEFGTLKSD